MGMLLENRDFVLVGQLCQVLGACRILGNQSPLAKRLDVVHQVELLAELLDILHELFTRDVCQGILEDDIESATRLGVNGVRINEFPTPRARVLFLFQ